MAKSWRDHAAPIIAAVILENYGQTEKEIRAILRDHYPFGQREHHPYRIWCDEINVQLGIKAKKKAATLINNNPNQTSLF